MKTRPIPPDALHLIKVLYQMEVNLGNIQKSSNWKTIENIDDYFDENSSEDRTDQIFAEIVRSLSSIGFTPDDIAEAINRELSQQSRLPYCDASEVKAALLQS